MTEVQPGDVVFSFVDKAIRAIGVAKSTAFESRRPLEFPDQAPWKQDGYRVRVSYRELSAPLAITPVAASLHRLLPDHYSPLTKSGTGVQGYLFALPDEAGIFLPRDEW